MIENQSDTICAVSTPAGSGGIAVVRVSGPDAISLVSKIWRGRDLHDSPAREALYGTVVDTLGEPLDHPLLTVFRSPASFTGEDVVEISVHGSMWIQQELIASLLKAGARLAGPGEFTRRAVTAGKLDLAEAEGVADIIASTSRASLRLAMSQMRGDLSKRLAQLREQLVDLASLLELELDFSEEDVEFASRSRLLDIARATLAEVERLSRSFAAGNAIKEGIPVAIVGDTNVGKSSLLNALVGEERAIVSPVHGTTRDLIEDTVRIGDFTFRFIDTAGLRHTTDTVESIGIERSYQALERARIAIVVVDASQPAVNQEILSRVADTFGNRTILVINKTDLVGSTNVAFDVPATMKSVKISALRRDGIDTLREKLVAIAREECPADDVVITNSRHYEALQNSIKPLEAVIAGLQTGISGDFIAQDLRQALYTLGTITGEVTTSDLLATIFSRFCIGK